VFANDNVPKPSATLPRSSKTIPADERLEQVQSYLDTLVRPASLDNTAFAQFLRYLLQFFYDGSRLWKRHPHGQHQLVVWPVQRLGILRQAHDDTDITASMLRPPSFANNSGGHPSLAA
jgi:hypothetical protein